MALIVILVASEIWHLFYESSPNKQSWKHHIYRWEVLKLNTGAESVLDVTVRSTKICKNKVVEVAEEENSERGL